MFSTRSRGGQLGRNHSLSHPHAGKGYATKSTKAETFTKKHISKTGARCFAHLIPELCNTATVITCKWPRRIRWFVPISPYTPATCRVWSFSPRDTVSGLPRMYAITQGSDESHHGQWNNRTPSQHWVNSRVPLRPQTWCTLCPHDLPWYIK